MMTNQKIKEYLLKLHECKTDFSVTMTGKVSNRVNGFYKPSTCEIFLHNKNFKTDNELIYTAVHEFVHHIIDTEQHEKSTRCHSNAFWAMFYDFLDKAVNLGFYTRNRSSETTELINQAKELQKQIISAQKALGELLIRIYKSCEENNERIEDVVEHDLQMSRNKAKDLMRIRTLGLECNDEVSKVIISASSEVRKAVKEAVACGATIAQMKAISKSVSKHTTDFDSPEKLYREKKHLEKTIETLSDRLAQVEELLNMRS